MPGPIERPICPAQQVLDTDTHQLAPILQQADAGIYIDKLTAQFTCRDQQPFVDRPCGIVRLTLDDNRVTGEARYLETLGRVRDVVQGPDGDLWLLTDKRDGALIRIQPQK